ncbi:MAG: succinate dehydrogenase/fumarate reductase iron-sulfur subunit [bacterium]|jgi:succinate dehydrogenase / fumarate reductase iron-sulfur subunit
MKLKILRFDPERNEGRYDVFEVPAVPGMSVLTALFYVQDELDDSLSLRYSCRGAVCGNCAMLINKVPRLACRTQVEALLKGPDGVDLKPYPAVRAGVEWDPENEILVEPLPHLPVIKDLVVDMTRFFEYYRAVEPVLKPAEGPGEREFIMEPSAVRKVEPYTNCILCAACFGACPVNAENPDYKGPAALAKLYRFHIDTREAPGDARLMLANEPSGWWGCEFHTNCRKVCPKQVPPNLAIGAARREITEGGKAPPDKK